MTDIRERLSGIYGTNLLFMDGPEFDEAILGVAAQAGQSSYAVVYDVGRVLAVLERQMSYDEAREYFDFNVACAYVGENTPIYLDTWP